MHPYHLGDHLVTQRFGYEHHGLYIGHGDVIHYANHQPELSDPGRTTSSSLHHA